VVAAGVDTDHLVGERFRGEGVQEDQRPVALYDFVDGERESGTELLLRRRDGSTYLVELV